MSDIQVWREGTSGEPKFSDKFEVVKKATLQVTDIATNRNKYYAIELHTDKNKYRVYTHYGRTDDLSNNPDAGIRECRYVDSLDQAEFLYEKIYKSKTSGSKGYQELNLASARIGSRKTIGQSSGEIDEKTLKKLAAVTIVSVPIPKVTISTQVQKLVDHLYGEATKKLTKTVNATITANGIETPLGVLTIGQIDKGQQFLDEIALTFSKKQSSSKSDTNLTKLSGQFYTVIPHNFGRSKADALEAVIDSADKINTKQDTLQLMRDMLNVSGKGQNVLANPEVDKKYIALGCDIAHLSPTHDDYKKISKLVGKKVKNIFVVKRPVEHLQFTKTIDNHKLLFHGSGAHNWVGILSRGLMMPKQVVKLGVHRTDGGWLGNGIYFGDNIQTSLNYAHANRLGSVFITVANVALGKTKKFHKITYGMDSAPDGFHSTHGDPTLSHSQFSDHEFVIYDTKQQKLEYLLEM